MKQFILLPVVCFLAFIPQVSQGQGDKTPSLEGNWKLISSMEGGKPAPNKDDITMSFKGNTFKIMKGDMAMIEGTFKLETKNTPNHIDMMISKGPDRFEGKKALGIFSLKKNTLQWCTSEPGTQTRPTEFKSPEGSNIMYATLERIKKSK